MFKIRTFFPVLSKMAYLAFYCGFVYFALFTGIHPSPRNVGGTDWPLNCKATRRADGKPAARASWLTGGLKSPPAANEKSPEGLPRGFVFSRRRREPMSRLPFFRRAGEGRQCSGILFQLAHDIFDPLNQLIVVASGNAVGKVVHFDIRLDAVVFDDPFPVQVVL